MTSDVVRWWGWRRWQRSLSTIIDQGKSKRSACIVRSSLTYCASDNNSIVHHGSSNMYQKMIICLWLVINFNVIFVLGNDSVHNNNRHHNSSSNINNNSVSVGRRNDTNNNDQYRSLNESRIDMMSSPLSASTPLSSGHYTPTWAVHIPNGDRAADHVAATHGFINLGKIVDSYYHFHHNTISKRSLEPAHQHHGRLCDDPQVRWAQQQKVKSRQKRDFTRLRQSRTSSSSLSSMITLNDPKWPQMWYLNRGNGFDMNVIPAWREGITGKGVVVTILDDGLESDHPDLEQNYDPKASYDVNSHDDDPMPHYDMTDSNRHGTRCAGEVAATANNSLCAVGIAFGARVGGVRMLDGDVTDAVEARSLSLNPQHIDIYSASWGPDDDGKTVDGPGEMATRAFIEGVTKGRNGKGSIFIWASGNGGREHDNCNCDGYTNSIWTLSISSATEEGSVPWYSEKCSSTLATTYSSGGTGEKQVVTTDLHHTCTASHTGTSASAPLAAGIAALVLEANQNLTWRDLQHIVVRTAKPGNLKDPTWSKNGVGRRVSHSFGYGLMDAAAMVRLARTWKTIPEQQRCEINAPHLDKSIPPKSHLTLQLTVQHCKGVNYLEHVQAKISLTSPRRGDLQIYLKSPAGTKVTLLTSRSHDSSRSGFTQWPFMSVHTWGEAPHGNWQLEIHNEGRFMAQITQWDLIFHGTEEPPQPNDPPRYIKTASIDSGFANEFDHNALEFESDATSGQWRDTHEIGENHIDVQRTASNDQTGSACKNFSPNQRCIECVQGTFLYEGRCYTSCPERSYMVPEHPVVRRPSYIKAIESATTQKSTNQPTRSISLRYAGIEEDDADDDDDDDDDNVDGGNGPLNYRAIMQSLPQKVCASCHFSCLKCRGPEEYDCTACAPDALYSERSFNESFCVRYDRNGEERENGGGANSSEAADSSIQKVPFSYVTHLIFNVIGPIFLAVSLALAILAYALRLRWCCGRQRKYNYTYDPIAKNENDAKKTNLSVDFFSTVNESMDGIDSYPKHDDDDDDEDESADESVASDSNEK